MHSHVPILQFVNLERFIVPYHELFLYIKHTKFIVSIVNYRSAGFRTNISFYDKLINGRSGCNFINSYTRIVSILNR